MGMQFTDQEIADLRIAFNALYDIISRMPSSLGDFVDRKTLTAIHKTADTLEGISYNPASWDDPVEQEG